MTTELTDYYKILGINSDASVNDINQSYRRLCKLYHPDRGGDPKIFEEINEAYIVLKDKNQKQKYDNIIKLQKITKDNNKNLKEEFKMYVRSQVEETTVIPNTVTKLGQVKVTAEKINKKSFKFMVEDLELIRQQDDIENEDSDKKSKTENNNEKFNNDEFDRYLESHVKGKKHKQEGKEIIQQKQQVPAYEPYLDPLYTHSITDLPDTSFTDQFTTLKCKDTTEHYVAKSLEDILKEREGEMLRLKSQVYRQQKVENGIYTNLCNDIGLEPEDSDLLARYTK